jgi:hypothetical protein
MRAAYASRRPVRKVQDMNLTSTTATRARLLLGTIVLLVNTLYLVLTASPTPFYFANVILHMGLGLVLGGLFAIQLIRPGVFWVFPSVWPRRSLLSVSRLESRSSFSAPQVRTAGSCRLTSVSRLSAAEHWRRSGSSVYCVVPTEEPGLLLARQQSSSA